MLAQVKISISNHLYLKNPESSDLGRKIVEQSVEMIEDIGFDEFTFRKLGVKIGSNESSIYRYFESKQKLLLYLSSLFWGFKELKMHYDSHNISNKKEKLEILINVILEDLEVNEMYDFFNVKKLQNIMISDFSKLYFTKNVNQINNDGNYLMYKRVVLMLKDAINDYNPDYLFPRSLANFVIEGVLHQSYINNHFKKITDISDSSQQNKFIKDLIFKTLA